ncbi:FtsW/RodA/SpoVE family cell cycle protein [Planctomycetota bacterium]
MIWKFCTYDGIFNNMYKFLKGRLIGVRILLLATALALIVFGIATIYAIGNPAQASQTAQESEFAGLWEKQAVFAVLAVFAFIAVNMVNYRRLGTVSYWLYAFVLVLLAILLLDKFVDISIANVLTIPLRNGTRRWIVFTIAGWSISMQPSELCKLAYILALAWYLRYRSNYRNFTALIGPFLLTLLPMFLILLEPDLGTVLLMMPILFIMLFIAGAKVKHLLIVILLAVLVSPLLWYKMNDYQRIRISSVLLQNEWVQQKAIDHPALANVLVGKEFTRREWENNWGYHLIRAKYAVASGGMKGYGFRKGPFIKYNFFLPYRHNDFIFAAIAHQWGFLGSVVLLLLYVVIIYCGLEIAANNTDPFGRLLATGIVIMFAVEIIVNICMTLGMTPITGLTLPLVSYGGSSLLVSMISIGLLHNVGRQRPFSVAKKSFEEQKQTKLEYKA